MAVAVNKRSVMTLFSGPSDLYSHQTRIVLAEKGVNVDITYVDHENPSEELAEITPNNDLPTLVDRELVLYNSRIIMEYLDERFPHPPLMPVYPVERAKSRSLMQRIENEWYPLVPVILSGDTAKAEAARATLRSKILEVAPVFDHFAYFMSEEFTIVDCYMAPLLWRLPELKIDLGYDNVTGLKSYMVKIFERESFQASMTETEREIRVGG
ncbi:stringent starvation protein SspA [Psychromonas sp. 14N.309.X.WAT.B.A12]|uniref:stringent starvation protein SspA n=1 Tax=unclassified Psychromonas TaxID=2614957 RepID=UPI0025B1A6B7|nr:stringent starvation protein SspA [Psychromonas sp. 14N.309.X.WAT.B.A12]MDN2662951.1 stringent starvation protein A [Psychromonas sp. 14N.309.X.WAT.B.A12]